MSDRDGVGAILNAMSVSNTNNATLTSPSSPSKLRPSTSSSIRMSTSKVKERLSTPTVPQSLSPQSNSSPSRKVLRKNVRTSSMGQTRNDIPNRFDSCGNATSCDTESSSLPLTGSLRSPQKGLLERSASCLPPIKSPPVPANPHCGGGIDTDVVASQRRSCTEVESKSEQLFDQSLIAAERFESSCSGTNMITQQTFALRTSYGNDNNMLQPSVSNNETKNVSKEEFIGESNVEQFNLVSNDVPSDLISSCSSISPYLSNLSIESRHESAAAVGHKQRPAQPLELSSDVCDMPVTCLHSCNQNQSLNSVSPVKSRGNKSSREKECSQREAGKGNIVLKFGKIHLLNSISNINNGPTNTLSSLEMRFLRAVSLSNVFEVTDCVNEGVNVFVRNSFGRYEIWMI